MNPVPSDTNPWFPYAYPASYTQPFNQRTVSQENALTTVARLNSDVRRNFYGLQLFIWETYGLKLGVGTAWRVQPIKPGHAAPGNSWHEGIPVEAKVNAFAIDTVGCDANGTPCHGDVWALQERHGPQFGFVSFLYLNDRPHIQSLYIPRSRSFRNSISQLPTYPLPHQPIDQRYDVDYFNIDDPLAGSDVPPPADPPPPVIVDPPPVYPSDPPPTGGTYTVDATRSNVQLGSQGKMVRRAQFACQLITGGPALCDGDFGPATDASIRNFQHFFGLTVDGQVGPKTWTVLEQITNE